MAVSSRVVTVSTTATRLDSGAGSDGTYGSAIVVYNGSDSTVYLGGSDVSTTNGLPIATLTWSPGMDLAGDALYGRVASGTKDVKVLEVGV